jgi:arylsulfatase A-like enzyme
VTFAPFGLGRGWDDFEMISPVLDAAAGEPFERAEKWLERELDDSHMGPRLLVIHARGFHPPWDVSRDELQGLKPDEYSGLLDARRAGITLATLRNRKRGLRHLQDEDWVRLRSLEDTALAKQDAGLERLIALLKRKNAWESSLLLFMGDVAGGEPPDLPFDPRGTLNEDRLAVPLIAKFPRGELAGRDVAGPVGFEDITATLLATLGLPLPARLAGAGLHERASDHVPVVAQASVATAPGRYATRLGGWLLRGEFGKRPTLCALDIDPVCATDVFDQRSIAARALWLATFTAEKAAQKLRVPGIPDQPAELDPATAAALTVWGDLR